MTAPTAIETITLGTVMRTEFQKPTWMPVAVEAGAGRRPGLDPGLEGELERQREDVAEPDLVQALQRGDDHHVERQQEEDRGDDQDGVDA